MVPLLYIYVDEIEGSHLLFPRISYDICLQFQIMPGPCVQWPVKSVANRSKIRIMNVITTYLLSFLCVHIPIYVWVMLVPQLRISSPRRKACSRSMRMHAAENPNNSQK